MKTQNTLISSILVLGLSAGPALSQQNPAAHQHGRAQLQLVIDGEQIELLLQSPAYNLAGFEHRPETPEQQAAIDSITQWQQQTAAVNTTDGQCFPVAANLHADWGQGQTHEHDHHHEDSPQQGAGHGDMEIAQSLRCPGLQDSAQFETGLLERFPAMEQLSVQWVGPQGQGSARLSRGQNRFYPGE